MNRLAVIFAAVTAALALAVAAQAAPEDYGIETFDLSLSTPQAGDHSDFTTVFALKKDSEGGPVAPTRVLDFDFPPGYAGNPAAFPKCTAAQLTAPVVGGGITCPIDSQVGVTEIVVYGLDGNLSGSFTEPIYNMVPPPGVAARLGFVAVAIPTVIDTEVDAERGYALSARLEGLSTIKIIDSSTTTIWGVPADPNHDSQRITPYEVANCGGSPCTAPGGQPRKSNLVPTPFFSNPTNCGPQGTATFNAESYELFGQPRTMSTLAPQISGCGLLDFKPAISLKPTTAQAESATGLDVELTLPQEGLKHPNLLAQSHLKRVEVALPEGVTVNPSAAAGLGVCSPAQFAKETATSGPNQGCPETAKIGNLTVETPLLEETASGSLYIAKPFENPFGSLLALYMTIKIPERGVLVKVAGKVTPDPETGQLVTTFDDLPQLPFESFKLRFREGARAPLITPPACGDYETVARLVPWSASDPDDPKASEVTTLTSSFEVGQGPNHGPCPAGGTQPFEPGFTAGALNNDAGSHSPFYMRLTRPDGDQDLTRFDATLPPGVVAKVAGVSQCPDAAIEAAKAKSGKAELTSASCPANSEIGHILAGAGVGQVLTYVSGKIYLAGPVGGAPLSVVVVTPAVAGPFDVGTVVTREALTIDPQTALVEVDGALSDPIPHILAGIPLKVRDIRVSVDRPQFALNPTSCDPSQTAARIWGGGLDPFSTADNAPVSLADRFQVANCSLLGFRPRLSLHLKGGTMRGGHPALTAILRPRPGDANIAGASAVLPRSEFLDQAHIRTICTRVQFAADQCPKAAIYGQASAATPLLDFPITGPVYLRSSDNLLPDLVADLRGPASLPIRFEVVGRTDSIRGGIRNTFDVTPDVPVSSFVLRLQGGHKGLLVNSRDICARTFRAKVSFEAHNGKTRTLRPPLRASCGKRR